MVKWIQLDVRHMACRLGPVVDESRFPQIIPLQVPSTSTVSPKPLIVGVFKITRSNCEKRRGPEKIEDTRHQTNAPSHFVCEFTHFVILMADLTC